VRIDELTTTDLILTFERRHRSWVLKQAPDVRQKTLTIRRAARIAAQAAPAALMAMQHDADVYGPADDFPDPFRRGAEAAEKAISEIDDLLRVILPAIGAAAPDGMPARAARLSTRRSIRREMMRTR
jgi:protein-tyrosine-phosphatase